MQQKHDAEVERHPRQIAQRRRRLAGQESANVVEVANGDRPHPLHKLRTQPAIHTARAAGEYSVTCEVEARAEPIQQQHQQRSSEELPPACAGSTRSYNSSM